MTASKSLPGLISKIARHACSSAVKEGLLSTGRRATSGLGAAQLAGPRRLLSVPMSTAALMGHQMAAQAVAKAQMPNPSPAAISTCTAGVSVGSGNGVAGAAASETAVGDADDEGVSHEARKTRKRKPLKRDDSSIEADSSSLACWRPITKVASGSSLSSGSANFWVTPSSFHLAAPPLMRSISCTAQLEGPAAVAAVRAGTSNVTLPRQVHSADAPDRRREMEAAASAKQSPKDSKQAKAEKGSLDGAVPTESIANQDAIEEFLTANDVRITAPQGHTVPDPVLTLDEAPFPAAFIRLLKRAGYEYPTAIQSQAWPIAKAGSDMVAIASTGSGKTLAYLLPAMAAIYTGEYAAKALAAAPEHKRYLAHRSKRQQKVPLVLVLAPTRELAQQIEKQAVSFGRELGINSIALFGGASKMANIRQLRYDQPQVVVATPGRLLDLLQTGVLTLEQVRCLVLDEADRMLDMGFEDDIRSLLEYLPLGDDRQSLFFSATWPREVRSLAREIAGRDAVTVFMGNVSEQPVAARTITQEVEFVKGYRGKLDALKQYLKQLMDEHAAAHAVPADQKLEELGRHRHTRRPGSREPLRVIVFVGTKVSVEVLEGWFNDNRDELPQAVVIHGERRQMQREAALQRFRTGSASVLIATDVAARGLDIPHVAAVVNFDVPPAARSEDYVHRIGRTGRAGAAGKSLALLDRASSADAKFAQQLVKIMTEAGQEVSEELEVLAHGRHPSSHRADGYRSGGHGGYGSYGRGARSTYRQGSKKRSHNAPFEGSWRPKWSRD